MLNVDYRFSHYSTPWRQHRQEFVRPQLEGTSFTTERFLQDTYNTIESENAEIERLKFKIEELKNDLLKCALFLKNNGKFTKTDDYGIPLLNERRRTEYGQSEHKKFTQIHMHIEIFWLVFNFLQF